MDIAEIRKKAKAQNKAGESVDNSVPREETLPEAEEFDLSEPEEFDLSDEGSGDVVGHTHGLTLGEASAAAAVGPSGLDLLFAATEEYVPATDEFSDQDLESPAEAKGKTSRQYLAFHLGDEEYALDIKRISEIIKVREFTDIPRAPEFILGIISLRGVVVPVFDLRRRLNLGVSEMLPSTRIVVCQFEDVSVGLLVDSINQVVNLRDEEVEPPPGVLSGLDREMVSGLGRFQNRMIILLNIQSVLNVVAS